MYQNMSFYLLIIDVIDKTLKHHNSGIILACGGKLKCGTFRLTDGGLDGNLHLT